jgi:hypothetical protein
VNNPVVEEMMEERIKKQEEENIKLKQQLEITQAVVDEIALGGTAS